MKKLNAEKSPKKVNILRRNETAMIFISIQDILGDSMNKFNCKQVKQYNNIQLC